MKIVICTTPIRPVPTFFPPFGSMAVMQALRAAGYDPVFVDIDALRPEFDQAIERIQREEPELIGISAVVSTAYAYVKRLALRLRQILPKTRIIVGGNLAASAELLLRFCGVDVCVIGEGEKIIVSLADYYRCKGSNGEYRELQGIKGIAYLDEKGEMEFTGYETAIPAAELSEPDFSILERFSNIDNFIRDPLSRSDFAQDPRTHEPHRAGKKMATVLFTKGCVARCTFCHRWDRGFRQRPPKQVIAHIKLLIERYNVGFLQFGDENFGSDRRATEELIALIKPLDLLWQVGGVRARTVDSDLLRRMREAGCVALYYGFETGSPSILKVMEKNLRLEDNLEAARFTREAGLSTIYQLVLGMPGENHRTIRETIGMVKDITGSLPEPPQHYLSINYVQALPGTPVYEYARARGIIGPRLEDEEAYLLRISDVDPADTTKALNFTEFPYFVMRTWRPKLLLEATSHWYRKKREIGGPPSWRGGKHEDAGYFNQSDLRFSPFLLTVLSPANGPIIWAWTLLSEVKRAPAKVFLRRIVELVAWLVQKPRRQSDYRSLRRIMRESGRELRTKSEQSMEQLRLGR